jgi:hypothetical protein
VSHKLLRWLSALFLGVAAGAAVAAIAALSLPWQLMLAAAAAATLSLLLPPVRRLASLGVYFVTMNVASLMGVVKGTCGRVSGTWATPRQAAGRSLPAAYPLRMFLLAAAALVAVPAALMEPAASLTWLFWASAALLVYVYAGYPLLLLLLRRVARRPVTRAAIEPSICVFVAANDEQAVIAEKIRNSLALDYPAGKLEVVVASDGSVDGTNEIVRSFADPRVRLIAYPVRRGKIAAINDGVQTVTSEILVFSDANTLLHRDALRALVRSLADPTVGVVSGDVVLMGKRADLAASEDLYYRYERGLQALESEIGSMIGVDGALYAIRRELFEPPPPDTILDDLAIPMAAVRAGYRTVFEPDALAFEQGSRSAWEEFSRKSRIVAGAVQFLRRPRGFVPAPPQVVLSLVSHKVLRWLSPAFALAALVACAAVVAAGGSTFYAIALAAQLVFLAAGLAGCVPSVRRRRVIAIAHYLCLVHSAAAVGFVRGLLGLQPTTWRRFPRTPLAAS